MLDKIKEALARALGGRGAHLREGVSMARARGDIVHSRPTRWLAPGVPDPDSYVELSHDVTYNVITTVGRDFLHTQGYGTSPGANGLNYIGLSNDALTENSASTTLSNEIAANGLSRAIGAFAHTPGATTSTISKTFTCATGAQAAQKAALFTASSAGTMCHVLAFTQRSLQIGDTLAVTFTITLS